MYTPCSTFIAYVVFQSINKSISSMSVQSPMWEVARWCVGFVSHYCTNSALYEHQLHASVCFPDVLYIIWSSNTYVLYSCACAIHYVYPTVCCTGFYNIIVVRLLVNYIVLLKFIFLLKFTLYTVYVRMYAQNVYHIARILCSSHCLVRCGIRMGWGCVLHIVVL